MRLAIADPPYPARLVERVDRPAGRMLTRARASRWYSGHADHHPAAAEWDDPARHAALLDELLEQFDGFALATTPDGLAAYGPLPPVLRILAWVKPNAMPGGGRIHNRWEPVVVRVPAARANRAAGVMVPDVLVAAADRAGFAGAKPAAWTRWVLDVLGYDPEADELADLFPGSGAVAAAAAQGVLL